MADIELTCPHCGEPILIQKLNCGVFRHGVFKKTYKQINPHASKPTCEKYVRKQLIYGCGKPFQVTLKDNVFAVDKCGYE